MRRSGLRWLKRNPTKIINVDRLLVLVTGDRIGDALLKWPIIAGLKRSRPGISLTWIAARRASVFCGPLAPLVDGVIDESIEKAGIGISWKEFLQPAPRYQADIVISTEPKIRNAILDRRITHRKFISPAANFFFSDVKPDSPAQIDDSVQRRLRRLFELAVGQTIEPVHHVPLSDKLISQATQLLPPGRTYVGFSPGAGGERKRWPLERFIQAAETQEKRGRIAVFFLGPEETHLLAEIKSALPHALLPEYDELGPRGGGVLLSIALARQLHCSVANDSGGGHILAAGGRPLISLYGHTSAAKFRPAYGKHYAISAAEFGSEHMEAIEVETVTQAIDSMLALC